MPVYKATMGEDPKSIPTRASGDAQEQVWTQGWINNAREHCELLDSNFQSGDFESARQHAARAIENLNQILGENGLG